MLLSFTDKKSEAEAEYRKAIALWQKLADDYPAVTEFRSDLAKSHNNLGILCWIRASRRKRRRSSARRSRSWGSWPTRTPPSPDSASRWHFTRTTSPMLINQGKPSEAGTELRKAIALLQKLADDNPAVIRLPRWTGQHPQLPRFSTVDTGKPTEAEAESRAAIAIMGKVVDDAPKVLDHRQFLAAYLSTLGIQLLKLGRPAEALDAYGRAYTLLEQLVKENPAEKVYLIVATSSLVGRGRARRALGDPAGAAADVRLALRLSEGLRLPEGYAAFRIACSHAALAGLAGQEGTGVSAAEGKAHADQAMALLRKAVDAGFRTPRLSHRGCPRPAPRAGGLQEAARRAGAEIGRQAEVTELLRDRGGYRIGREWKR